MATELTLGLSVDEYLDRSFDPECELLGGKTSPKPVVLQSQNPRMYRDVLDKPPLLCVEVVSPSQLPK